MTQEQALDILKTGANVFLTGSPGSGKTFVINEFISWLLDSGVDVAVTAATGIAATHVGGMTIHSWSGIGIVENLSSLDVDRIAGREPVARRINKANVLIIDEISMISADTFAMVDAVCREVRRTDAPFGGLSVVLVGDFFQLPPVSRARGLAFAYESGVWRALNPIPCYLTEQHRQDDEDFLAILSAIRSGEIDEYHVQQLAKRHVSGARLPSGVPRLYSHNVDVDRLNAGELAKIAKPARSFRMTGVGRENLLETLKRNCLSPEQLDLKEGAAVMFTKNSPQGKFVNGTLGTVAAFEKGSGFPLVSLRSGALIAADPMDWQMIEDGKIRASITQVPLRLAYAMTVHKSQGMSMDSAVVDLSRAFEYGQGYVALSRVRTLEGLYLLGLNDRALAVRPSVREADGEFRDGSRAAVETFSRLPEGELKNMQKAFVVASGGSLDK